MIDQLEYESLIEKIKKRVSEGDFEKAAKVIDKIPWHDVDDINVIVYAANVYELAENYKDAKELIDSGKALEQLEKLGIKDWEHEEFSEKVIEYLINKNQKSSQKNNTCSSRPKLKQVLFRYISNDAQSILYHLFNILSLSDTSDTLK